MLTKFGLVAFLSVSLCAQGWVDRTAAGGPPAMYTPHMCYDPVRNYTLLVGGVAGSNPWQGQTWSFDGLTWTARGSSSEVGPVAVEGTSGQLLMATYQTTYAWNGTNWQVAGGGFNGTTPNAIAYDPVRQQLISIAQISGSSFETRKWLGSSWQLLAPTSNPSSGNSGQYAQPTMAFDPIAQKIVLAVSGTIGVLSGGTTVQVPATRWYEWNGFGWNQRLPTNAPNIAGAMATDTNRQRVVMFDGDHYLLQPNHTWAVANGTLTRLVTPVEPSLRSGSSMAFDPQRGVCVMFGGYNQGGYMADTWEFDLGPLASFTSYGPGCVGSRGVPNIAAQGASLPRIGTNFTAHITNLPWTGPAFLVLGLSNSSYGSTPLPIDLGFLGAPTCALRVSIDDLQPVVNILGSATWSWQIPPFPGHPFYVQVLPIDPGVNALALTASNACHGVIGL